MINADKLPSGSPIIWLNTVEWIFTPLDIKELSNWVKLGGRVIIYES